MQLFVPEGIIVCVIILFYTFQTELCPVIANDVVENVREQPSISWLLLYALAKMASWDGWIILITVRRFSLTMLNGGGMFVVALLFHYFLIKKNSFPSVFRFSFRAATPPPITQDWCWWWRRKEMAREIESEENNKTSIHETRSSREEDKTIIICTVNASSFLFHLHAAAVASPFPFPFFAFNLINYTFFSCCLKCS